MKYSIAVQFTLIICFSTYISAQRTKPVGYRAIQQYLNLSADEFVQKCEAKGVVDKLTEQRYRFTQLGYSIAHELVKKAKKLPAVHSFTWNDLIAGPSIEHTRLQALSNIHVDEINECLDEKYQLTGEKKIDLRIAIFNTYCTSVKRLAKRMYEMDRF